jgi:hypothetical protein
MSRLILDSPEIKRLKDEIDRYFIEASEVKDVSGSLHKSYWELAEANISLIYEYQDIKNDGRRELWLPKILPIPEIDEKALTEIIWIPCSVCGYMGIYQYNDLYATFSCQNPPCRSWYEIQKNRECPQCWYPKKYSYYYDNRVAPHVRCVTTYQQCMNCSYHVDRAYYWYYD